MGSKNTSTKNVLQDHSQAKVKLYTDYLSLYLSILGNTLHMSRIHLFDVLCGEGKYENGAEGSALKGLHAISEYYNISPQSKMKLLVRLNDFGQSDVEPQYKKIQRVEAHASSISLPAGKVTLAYSDLEYTQMLEEVANTLKKMDSTEKSLVFIDPWGYKSISPKKLHDLFACGRCEILLFLPTTHMYRFANKSVEPIPEDKVRTCFKPLKKLLEELFDNNVPRFSTFEEFEAALLNKLKSKVGAGYSSSFVLETSSRNKYSLFFFTPHIKGLDAFNQACWKLDPISGRGYLFCKNPSQFSLLLPIDNDHINQVRDFIKGSPVTNRQLYEFGIVKRFLTRATNAALNHLREHGEVEVVSLDDKPNPKLKANYLKYNPDRLVQFKHIK